MKRNIRIFFFLILILLPLLGCSGGADDENEDTSPPVLEEDIVGIWAPIESSSGLVWQFREDGTFVDTEGVSYEYTIQTVDGINYLGFDREGLNITLTEEDQEELERVVGQSDFILIYVALMTSKDDLILEPAATLYGSDTYFNYTFETLIMRRQ